MQQLRAVDLVDQQFATTMDPTLTNDAMPRLQAEAAEHNCTLEVTKYSCHYPLFAFNTTSQHYLESKLTAEPSEEETQSILERIRHEPGTHHFFAVVARKVRPFTPVALFLTFRISSASPRTLS